jgi:protein ImuA
LHEAAPAGPFHLAASSGFTLALAARAARNGKTTLVIQPDFASHEGGGLYGAGLDLFGLCTHHLIVLRVARAADALFAMEEALRCRALSAVVTELTEDAPAANLTATRRLSLAARDGETFGLLLRHRATAEPSAAATRWTISAAPGARDDFGGIGATTLHLVLVKNRRGPCGQWTLTWNHHDGTFASATDSFGMAASPVDRSDRTPFARTA